MCVCVFAVKYIIDAPEKQVVGENTTITIRAGNYFGHTVVGESRRGLVLVVGGSKLYWPDSHTGGGEFSIVNGIGKVDVAIPIMGTVELSLADPVGSRWNADITSRKLLTAAEPADAPEHAAPPGKAHVNVELQLKGMAADSCPFGPQLMLRQILQVTATLLNVDILDIRVAAFEDPCNVHRSRRNSVVNMVLQVTTDDESASELGRLVLDLVTARANGESVFGRQLQAHLVAINKYPGMGAVASTSTAVVNFAGGSGVCGADAFTAWSACSVQPCGDALGYQVRSNQCPLASSIRDCATKQCGDCSRNNGGCPANAACSLNSQIEVECKCDVSVYIGTGHDCRNRTAEQAEYVHAEMTFNQSLSILAPTLAGEKAAIDAFEAALQRKFNLSSARLAVSAVRPLNEGNTAFSFYVLPPLSLSAPTARALSASFVDAVDNWTVSARATDMTLVQVDVLEDVASTTTTTTTGTTTTTATTTTTTVTSVTSTTTVTTQEATTVVKVLATIMLDTTATAQASTAAVVNKTSNDTNAGAIGATPAGGATTDKTWQTKDSVALLAVVNIILFISMVVFETIYLKTRCGMLCACPRSCPCSCTAARSRRAAAACTGSDRYLR